ncbi:26391_t:CDS:2, partial [Gigaspora margarita]
KRDGAVLSGLKIGARLNGYLHRYVYFSGELALFLQGAGTRCS